MLFMIAIIAGLCGIASAIIFQIVEIAFLITIAKICGITVVLCILIALIRFVVEIFSC